MSNVEKPNDRAEWSTPELRVAGVSGTAAGPEIASDGQVSAFGTPTPAPTPTPTPTPAGS